MNFYKLFFYDQNNKKKYEKRKKWSEFAADCQRSVFSYREMSSAHINPKSVFNFTLFVSFCVKKIKTDSRRQAFTHKIYVKEKKNDKPAKESN